MLPFHLDSLSSKELYKDVLVRLVHGKDLTLNYFELKNQDVQILGIVTGVIRSLD